MEIETKKTKQTTEKINKTKSCFFLKDKTDPLARFLKTKKGGRAQKKLERKEANLQLISQKYK